jgi:DNA processing protein
MQGDVDIEKAYRVALWRVNGIGAVRLARLLAYFGSALEAWKGTESLWQEAGIERFVIDEWMRLRRQTDPMRAYEWLDTHGVQVLCLGLDAAYPKNLTVIEKPPQLVFVKGNLQSRDQKAIAVVGTRKPTEYGREVTQRLVMGLVRAGFTIVSGLALGIDGMAHVAALNEGGRTVGVSGSGIDGVQPRAHAGLVEKMVTSGQGAVISLFAPGQPALPGNFVARNRYVAGLALGVLVIEGAAKSGTRITSDYAFDQQKPVFAVPGQITSAMSQAPNDLIQQGAHMVSKVEDILQTLNGVDVGGDMAEKKVEPRFTDSQQEQIWRLVAEHAREVDELARRLHLSLSVINTQLTWMEMQGLIVVQDQRVSIPTGQV